MKGRQVSLFEDQRLTLEDAIELSLDSLREYGRNYRHWVIGYSGGKDSSTVVTLTAWAVREGLVPRPDSLTIQYGDTRQEYPALYSTAMQMFAALEKDGFKTQVVVPPMDSRFYVYILGYGVPPPSNTFRWCTDKLKISPLMNALSVERQQVGDKFLLLNGVRLGESAARDKRIAIACNKDSGECGTGLMHLKNAKDKNSPPGMWVESPPDAVGDSLAPIVHWRTCHVFDWLYFNGRKHGYPEAAGIADVYGQDEVRTGCIGCNLASRDVALERMVDNGHEELKPLLELRSVFAELKKPHNRLRKERPEKRKDGRLAKNGQRMGPLTMEARAWGLEQVLDIQQRSGVDLINREEEARIKEMWDLNMWPDKWTGDEVGAAVPIDKITVIDGGKQTVVQPLLV